MLLLLITLIASVDPSPINMTLPPLITYNYTYPSENFSIKNRENFIYEFDSYGDPQVNITDISGKEASNSCNFVPSTVQHQILTQYKLPQRDKTQWSSTKTTFAIVKFQRLIYTVSNSLELTAYSYSEQKISKIASVHLDKLPEDYLDSWTHLALNDNESLLFLFSTHGIWRIQTKAILTKIDKLDIDVNFTVYSTINIGQWMLLSTISHGIMVYQITNKSLLLVGSITDHNQILISPIDCAYDSQSRLLFALDSRKNIYVYKMTQKTFYYYDVIQFQHSANFKILMLENRIYYSFLEGITMQIAELHYDSEKKSAELIRYYKEFDYVYDFLPTKNELYVVSHETLDIYNAFIDPRLISTAYGTRLPISSRKMQNLISDIYLFSSSQSLQLVKLRSLKPQIFCNFKKIKESININFKLKMTDCSSVSITSPKISYNSYCDVFKAIAIQINIPQEIQRQKILMYAVVIMVIMFFFAGLICLVQWRNGRLDIIDKLADEIRKYKDKERRAREFVEENDIQIPRSMVFSSHESEI